MRGKKLQKSKSLIKTVLFAAELSITWLLLLLSFSVFPSWALSFISFFTHSLTHPHSFPMLRYFFRYMTHNIRSFFTCNTFKWAFWGQYCAVGANGSIFFLHVFSQPSLSLTQFLIHNDTHTHIHALFPLSTASYMTKTQSPFTVKNWKFSRTNNKLRSDKNASKLLYVV